MSARVRRVAGVALGSLAVAGAVVGAEALACGLAAALAALPDALGALALGTVAVAPLVWAATRR